MRRLAYVVLNALTGLLIAALIVNPAIAQWQTPWQAIPVLPSSSGSSTPGSGKTLISIVVYSSTQTITIPTGASAAFIRMWGATGGSGGTNNSTITVTAGTGAGGYLEKYLTGMTAGNTLAYTQAAAGTAGPSGGGSPGGNASATTLASGTQTITTLTANGSNGTAGMSGTCVSNMNPGSAGATATNGDFNATGQAGASGVCLNDITDTTNIALGGRGGVNFMSIGADGIAATSTNTAGKAGVAGGLIIMWFG